MAPIKHWLKCIYSFECGYFPFWFVTFPFYKALNSPIQYAIVERVVFGYFHLSTTFAWWSVIQNRFIVNKSLLMVRYAWVVLTLPHFNKNDVWTWALDCDRKGLRVEVVPLFLATKSSDIDLLMGGSDQRFQWFCFVVLDVCLCGDSCVPLDMVYLQHTQCCQMTCLRSLNQHFQITN